ADHEDLYQPAPPPRGLHVLTNRLLLASHVFVGKARPTARFSYRRTMAPARIPRKTMVACVGTPGRINWLQSALEGERSDSRDPPHRWPFSDPNTWPPVLNTSRPHKRRQPYKGR